MTNLEMPNERDFGWELKLASSSHFDVYMRYNGQYICVANHSRLSGVTSEMIHWWFQHFLNMKVRLEDVKGYEGHTIPAYLLWHPSDHLNATLLGKVGPQFKAEAGDIVHIQEAIQYQKYGWKYPVDKTLNVFYCSPDGWAIGKKLPNLGEAMMLRIHFKDAIEGDDHLGVDIHYEFVIGLSGNDPVSRSITKKLTSKLCAEFFDAWHLHSAIEVGTFENFLPALYAQRKMIGTLRYSTGMNLSLPSLTTQPGFSRALFEERLQGYKDADNPYVYQAYEKPSFL